MRGLLLFGILVIAFPLRGYAGSFGVDPVRLTLPSGARSTSLSLQNHGDEPVVVQSELVAWAQEDGKEVLTPSRDLVVSPPVFKVAPGGTQLVRIGLLRPADPKQELTYRLLLVEVPPSQGPGQTGVSTRLRLGLPVFVLPAVDSAPVPQWRVRKAPEGKVELSLSNRGNAHIQAIDWKLSLRDGTPIAEEKHFAYVLPGQTHSWLIDPKQPWTGDVLELSARTSRGEFATELAAE